MKCSVCYGKGTVRGGKNCLLCDGTGQRMDDGTRTHSAADRTTLGTVFGVLVGAIMGILIGGVMLNGMSIADTDGQKGIFFLMSVFSFVIAGFVGGGVSAAISKDDRTLWQHMSLPSVAAFIVNFATCTYGIGASF